MILKSRSIRQEVISPAHCFVGRTSAYHRRADRRVVHGVQRVDRGLVAEPHMTTLAVLNAVLEHLHRPHVTDEEALAAVAHIAQQIHTAEQRQTELLVESQALAAASQASRATAATSTVQQIQEAPLLQALTLLLEERGLYVDVLSRKATRLRRNQIVPGDLLSGKRVALVIDKEKPWMVAALADGKKTRSAVKASLQILVPIAVPVPWRRRAYSLKGISPLEALTCFVSVDESTRIAQEDDEEDVNVENDDEEGLGSSSQQPRRTQEGDGSEGTETESTRDGGGTSVQVREQSVARSGTTTAYWEGRSTAVGSSACSDLLLGPPGSAGSGALHQGPYAQQLLQQQRSAWHRGGQRRDGGGGGVAEGNDSVDSDDNNEDLAKGDDATKGKRNSNKKDKTLLSSGAVQVVKPIRYGKGMKRLEKAYGIRRDASSSSHPKKRSREERSLSRSDSPSAASTSSRTSSSSGRSEPSSHRRVVEELTRPIPRNCCDPQHALTKATLKQQQQRQDLEEGLQRRSERFRLHTLQTAEGVTKYYFPAPAPPLAPNVDADSRRRVTFSDPFPQQQRLLLASSYEGVGGGDDHNRHHRDPHDDEEDGEEDPRITEGRRRHLLPATDPFSTLPSITVPRRKRVPKNVRHSWPQRIVENHRRDQLYSAMMTH